MKRFILSSGEVNRYGYRIVPEGINSSNYEANPILLKIHNDQILSVGKVTDLKVIDGKYTGIPEFDEKDPHGQMLKHKYEKGYMSGFSIRHRPMLTSDDPKDMLPGQTRHTVLSCELLEVSCVNLPGDQGAVALALNDGQTIDDLIPKLSLNQNQDTVDKNAIPTAITKQLGLAADTPIEQVVEKIKSLQDSSELALSNRANDLIKLGESAGVVNEDNRDAYLSLAKSDYDNAAKLIHLASKKPASEKKEVTGEGASDGALSLSGFLADLKKELTTQNKEEDADKLSFEWLSKNDPEKLNALRLEDPEKYEQLAAEYAKS